MWQMPGIRSGRLRPYEVVYEWGVRRLSIPWYNHGAQKWTRLLPKSLLKVFSE